MQILSVKINQIICRKGLKVDQFVFCLRSCVLTRQRGPAKATLLNDYFSSVFTHDDGNRPLFTRRVPYDVSLEYIEFTPAPVLRAFKQTKSKRSLDPNGFPSDFVKKLGDPLTKPLCVLFSFLFNSGQIPDDWRVANIVRSGTAPLFRSTFLIHSIQSIHPFNPTQVITHTHHSHTSIIFLKIVLIFLFLLILFH